jgi:hypothetical protein
MNHEEILQLGEFDSVELANYRTNWQLSLDGNLPGIFREQLAELLDDAEREVVQSWWAAQRKAFFSK